MSETALSSVVAVILNWKDRNSTVACLESIFAETNLREVVLVDNETQGELGDLRSERVHLIEHRRNLGFARGVNSGILYALARGADSVLVINNDATLTRGALDLLVKELDTARAPDMVAPLILNDDRSAQSTGGRFFPATAATRDLGHGPLDYLTWACVLVPRRTLETIGLLDERFFMYWEDVDYGLRLQDAGKTIAVVHEAVVTHALSASHGRAGSKIERYSTHGLVLLCLKRGGRALWLGLPYRILGRVVSRAASPARILAVLCGVYDGVRAHRSRWP